MSEIGKKGVSGEGEGGAEKEEACVALGVGSHVGRRQRREKGFAGRGCTSARGDAGEATNGGALGRGRGGGTWGLRLS